MASSSPKSSLPLRWAAIGLAIISFIWLPVEDRTVVFVLLLSAGWCAWGGVWVYQRTSAGLRRLPVIGAVSGLLVSPLAWLLAILKAGVHGHGFIDFTNSQLILIAETIPGWMLLGMLVSGLCGEKIRRDQVS